MVTLQDAPGAAEHNQGRLNRFQEAVRNMCGANTPRWTVMLGQVDERRGFGLTKSFVEILKRSVQEQSDVIYIFEDDARLLNPMLCTCEFRSTLWKEIPEDNFALVFAGHHERVKSTVQTSTFVFYELQQHFGSYAWAIRKKNFVKLIEYWGDQLHHSKRPLSPDIDLTRASGGSSTYLLRVPQLATHPSSYSNTWSKVRGQVADTERLSAVVWGCSTVHSNLRIQTVLEASEVIGQLIFANEFKSFSTVNSTERKAHLSDKFSSDSILQAVHGATSQVVALLHCDAKITKKQLVTLRNSFLRHPYLVSCWPTDTRSARKNSESLEARVFVIQRRMMHAFCGVSEPEADLRCLNGFLRTELL